MEAQPVPQPRPFLGLLMRCCNVYARIYMAAAGDAYAGNCPRCGERVRVPIVKEGGTSGRFFEAG